MPDRVHIAAAMPADVDDAVDVLATAFADDPITGFLLETGPGYRARLTQFFSLLMEARLALAMPVLVARSTFGIHGAAMGYSTARPAWPVELSTRWDQFEQATPGMTDRMACYDDIAEQFKPRQPHHYLGVIGTNPAMHGQGIGTQLLHAFCSRSAADPLSAGVYLETANPSNVRFYERAGFAVTGEGRMGDAHLRCMFRARENAQSN